MKERLFILAVPLIADDIVGEENDDLPSKIGIKYFSLYFSMNK